MELGVVSAFWAVSLLFILTPGADWAYAIAAGLRYRTVVPAISGLLAGHVLATVLVAAGVAAVVTRTPAVLVGLTVAGATYLVWLGVAMLRSAQGHDLAPPAAAGNAAAAGAEDPGAGARSEVSWGRQVWTGLGVSGLNPKVFLLFLALLPQFVDAGATWPVAGQMVALGAIHVASCAVVYTVVGTGARTLLSGRPGAARVVTLLSGGAMVVLGTVLIAEQLLA